jgi:hypothetical protein
MAKQYNATPEEISFYEEDFTIDDLGVNGQVDSISEDQISLYEQTPSQPLREDIPWYKSYPAAAGKAVLNGVQSLGRAFGPLQDYGDRGHNEYASYYQRNKNNNPLSRDEYFEKNPLPKETTLRAFLDEQLPSNDGFVENTLDRAGQILPFLLANPLGVAGQAGKAAVGGLAESGGLASGALRQTLLEGAKNLLGPVTRSLLGGASGETAKELGAPEWAQSLAEIPAQVVPGFGSRLIPNASQQSLVNEARTLGLTEQQITPLIQNARKVRALSKLSTKRGATEQRLKDSYDALGQVYGKLAARPESAKPLTAVQATNVGAGIQEKLATLPAGVRNKVSEDLSDLLKGEMNGQKLINFYQDINYYIGNGERQLGILKEPITTALGQISPQLAQDFNITNRLYQNYYGIASKLKPNIADDLVTASEGVRVLYGAFTGNYPLLAETIGEAGARKMASELLTNPRFQNLSKQMVEALNNNKLAVASKIYDSMLNLARDEDPESAVYLQRANFSSLGKQANKEEAR